MTDQDWNSRHARSLGVFLNGRAIPGHDEQGRTITDDSFLLLFNGHSRAVYWSLPKEFGGPWQLVMDTDRPAPESEPHEMPQRVLTRARTVVVLRSA